MYTKTNKIIGVYTNKNTKLNSTQKNLYINKKTGLNLQSININRYITYKIEPDKFNTDLNNTINFVRSINKRKSAIEYIFKYLNNKYPNIIRSIKNMEDIKFNELYIKVGCSYREIYFIRTYKKYIKSQPENISTSPTMI
jgi:hypothetical protein